MIISTGPVRSLFVLLLIFFARSHEVFSQNVDKEDFSNTLALNIWTSIENPMTGLRYQKKTPALGYYLSLKTDTKFFMAVAGPAITIYPDHVIFIGAGAFDGELALETGFSIHRRKLAFEVGLDIIPDDRFNFIVPTLGIGINF